MLRTDYIKMRGVPYSIQSSEYNPLPSVADPTQAQSGRDMVFNPKPIVNTRVQYAQGVKASEMRPFDAMYADKMEVFEAAKGITEETKKNYNKMQEETKKPAEN